MIDHIGFPVSDYARSKAFYMQALAPLGYTLVMEMPQNRKRYACRWFWCRAEAGCLDRRRRRTGKAAACRDRRQGSRHG